MTLEKRVENLENLVFSLIQSMNRSNEYIDADIEGTRQSIAELQDEAVQFRESKTAYISDTSCTFDIDSITGEIFVSCVTASGVSVPTTTLINGSNVTVSFPALTEVAIVSLFII